MLSFLKILLTMLHPMESKFLFKTFLLDLENIYHKHHYSHPASNYITIMQCVYCISKRYMYIIALSLPQAPQTK